MKKLFYLALLVAALLCIAVTANAATLITNTVVSTDSNGQFSVVVSLDEYTTMSWVRLGFEQPSDAVIEFVDADVPYGVSYARSEDDIVLSATGTSFSAGYLCTLNFCVTSGETDAYTYTYIWADGAVAPNGTSVYLTNSDYIWIWVEGISYGGTTGPVYDYTIDKLSTRTGPGTQYDGGGTYSVKNQWVPVYAKAWDSRNGIWWVKVGITYRGEERILWTGYKRFDHDTLFLDDLPTEVW